LGNPKLVLLRKPATHAVAFGGAGEKKNKKADAIIEVKKEW